MARRKKKTRGRFGGSIFWEMLGRTIGEIFEKLAHTKSGRRLLCRVLKTKKREQLRRENKGLTTIAAAETFACVGAG